MSERLTKTQKEALENLARYPDGEWCAFGSGLGSFRVALRALYHRAPQLLGYEARDGEEYFSLTAAGRAAAYGAPTSALRESK